MEVLSQFIPKVTVTELTEMNLDSPYWWLVGDNLKFEMPYMNKMIEISGVKTITYGSIILYLLCVTLIFPLTKPKRETTEKIAWWHFGGLFLYSFFAFGATLYHLVVANEFTSYEALLCSPVPAWLRLISITFTLSKVWEWIDTAIFLWRQKNNWGDIRQIEFLHTYHHATTLYLFLHVMNLPGTEKTGMLLNGFVHTLMYYHYGFRLPRAFRPIITAAQIVQLASVTIFHVHIPQICPAYSTYPSEHPFEYLIVFAIVPVYLLLFIKFFVQQYLCKSPETPKEKASTAEVTVETKKKA